MTKILICVDGESYRELGDRKFDAVMDGVDIILKNDPHTILKWSEAYWAFRSYGMDVRIMEGSVPDDVDEAALKRDLEVYLGEGMKPIIFIYIDREEKE